MRFLASAATSPERPQRVAPPRPTLSVVIPNYNHARYLERAVRAHLEQTVVPLEIIVVDDASTDESPALVERIAAVHPKVRLVRLERNAGVNGAMNRGLLESRGDYVCFSAADDVVTPKFAARSLEAAARYPEAGFCFSEPAEMAGDGRVRHLPLRLSDEARLLSPSEVEQLLRATWFAFPGHAVVYRRQALLSIGGFVEDLRWYADWFANCVLAFRHGACYLPDVLAVFRVSAGSYSARGLQDGAVQRRLVYRILDLLASERFADVAGAFRASALVPELRFRVLPWLLASPAHRRYLTPRLVARVLVRGTWWVVKPYAPGWVRPAARRLAFGRARPGSARGG
jgi:glycosyltransferase involved in cell wall biosynthesis